MIGTLGKALGSYGAYACANAEMVRYLINTARPLIFSTASPPPAVAGALAALELLEERPHRVQRLRANARVLRRALSSEGIPVEDVEMHIVPVIVGDERDAMNLCEATLSEACSPRRSAPPRSPGTSRLQLAVMASQTAEELREAARVIGAAARELGLDLQMTASRAARASGRAIEADGLDGRFRRRCRPSFRRAQRPGVARGPGPLRRRARRRRPSRGLTGLAGAGARLCAGCSSRAPARASARPS